jgi:hypothetical protein
MEGEGKIKNKTAESKLIETLKIKQFTVLCGESKHELIKTIPTSPSTWSSRTRGEVLPCK